MTLIADLSMDKNVLSPSPSTRIIGQSLCEVTTISFCANLDAVVGQPAAIFPAGHQALEHVLCAFGELIGLILISPLRTTTLQRFPAAARFGAAEINMAPPNSGTNHAANAAVNRDHLAVDQASSDRRMRRRTDGPDGYRSRPVSRIGGLFPHPSR